MRTITLARLPARAEGDLPPAFGGGSDRRRTRSAGTNVDRVVVGVGLVRGQALQAGLRSRG